MNVQHIENYLYAIEEKIVKNVLIRVTELNPTQELFNESELVQYNLIRKDVYNVTLLAHQFLMQKLIDWSFLHFFQKENTFFEIENAVLKLAEDIDFQLFKNINKSEFCEIIENLHCNFLNSEFVYQQGKIKRVKSKINLKETGSVYTQSDIAKEICLETINNRITQGVEAADLKILDFGCGTGRFYWAAFEVLTQDFGVSAAIAVQNLYAIDINNIALIVLKIKVLFATGIDFLEIINQNIIKRNMLMTKNGLMFQQDGFLDIQQDFSTPMQSGGFDVVVSNPPYFLLKINKNNTKDAFFEKYYQSLSEKCSQEVAYFRSSGLYQYSVEGMLNYYKLSIEMMLKLTKSKGEIGIICPSTLFGDVSSAKLRKHILGQNQLRKLEFFGENARLFDNVSQATAIFYISKSQKTENIDVKVSDNRFFIPYDLVKTTFAENMEIPQMDELGWDILKKLGKFKKIKEHKMLRNRRGEFDLLQFKTLITNQETGFRLVRGNMVNSVAIDYSKGNDFVEIEAFKKAKSSDFLQHDFQKIRLVCQQISNMDTQRRLKFVPCAENDILGNSCNYITINDLDKIKNLQTLLNAYILNWRFKVTSTNNHINNYELDELPLIDFTNFSSTINGNELKNNIEISKLYGLNKHEIEYILNPFFETEAIKSCL